MTMSLRIFIFVVFIVNLGSCEIWQKTRNCPLTCTCQLEHLTETAIYRFMQNNRKQNIINDIDSIEFNDVIYDNIETELFEEKTIVRSALCILQSEIDLLELLDKLPKDIESLSLIQGYNNGSKTIKFSYLNNFEKLISLELIGSNILTKLTNDHLICEIDTSLPNLRYLNLEKIIIKNSKKQIQNFVKEFKDDEILFEYTQKFDKNTHPLTIIQKGVDNEILPYEKYKKQYDNGKIPLFIGFKNLFLLRITNCELNNINWAMFDGLNNLEYLILDKNNIKFIPPFAFYGTPNLKTLSLAHNNLLDIQITDLAGLLELEYLDLSYNNFSQLSELSLPPFPKLKLANFGNNPITIIYPNTFEVMNTTDSLIIGSNDVDLLLMTNSFLGLKLLKSLTLNNLKINLLQRNHFTGMPNLNELILSGNIKQIEFDTFLDVNKLKRLILNNCKIQNVSMDTFIGLENLQILDLSHNQLEYLPPSIFDQLINIKEIYLNDNKFKKLPRDLFSKIHVKLMRLNNNPWHCSCEMSEWKPVIINRIKQKTIKQCDFTHDKNIECANENRFAYKYIYDIKVAPKCSSPKQYLNWNVFHAMRRLLKCPEYKPKFRKHHKRIHGKFNHTRSDDVKTTTQKSNLLKQKYKQIIDERNFEDNNLNALYSETFIKDKTSRKYRKYKKFITNEI